MSQNRSLCILVGPVATLMMHLLFYQCANDDWDVAVVGRLDSWHIRNPDELKDVLGRKLPCFSHFRAYDGVEKEGALRLANTLKGVSRARRVVLAEEHAKSLRLRMTGS